MPVVPKRRLSEGHRKVTGAPNETDRATRNRKRAIVPDTNPLSARYDLLRDLPRGTIRKAWFTLVHLLLEPGSHTIDMGCADGAMTYAMAVLNPQCRFTGIDHDKKAIAAAQERYQRPNLDYIIGDIGAPDVMKPGSVDAVVNSFILHEIYSGSHYNDRSVIQTLENQMSLLKRDGIMFIRDFAMPMVSEYVLMEMPDTPSTGDGLNALSEADLLVWYAEHARPRQNPGCTGFFLEELPPRFPRTRLFRLPSKWAYEFIMRKDEREIWEDELPKEYTFFTEREYRKTLRAMGARVLYTAPHWDDRHVKDCFDGHFRMYEENGNPVPTPPTSFIAIAQKIGDALSMRLNERRPASGASSSIRIQAMRNEVDGRMIDVVTRDLATVDILPWRRVNDEILNIFVHIGVPRGIVNAVPRNGRDLDGKRWSGHMTEAIALDSETLSPVRIGDAAAAATLMRDAVGLRPVAGRGFEDGPAFYPAPDFIDERIETRFIEVEAPNGPIEPKSINPDLAGFQTKGRIVELDAQTVLNAIAVGTIPNAQLELQILALYQKLGMKAESWVDTPLSLPEIDVQASDIKDVLVKLPAGDSRYRSVRGSAGQWRPLHSVFVEEGHVNGSLTGLASREIDFVVSDEATENIAVILPLVKNLSGEVLAGYVTDYLPVPQRHTGSGLSVTAPTIPLPRDITSIETARQYIADMLKVQPENVTKLGESYFCHIGITPQRVYPFAVTEPISGNDGPFGRGAYAPIDTLWQLLYWDNSTSFMKTMSMAYKNLGEASDLSPTWDFGKKLAASHDRPVTTHATDMRGSEGGDNKKSDSRKPLPK